MIATIETLFSEAMTLPDDSRLRLAERLFSTIKEEPALEAEQLQEVARRVQDVRSGQVETLPGEEVFREIERSLAARRSA
jgi:putative addiction module component (TIGR02574 family)